jgi:hypothetical protein
LYQCATAKGTTAIYKPLTSRLQAMEKAANLKRLILNFNELIYFKKRQKLFTHKLLKLANSFKRKWTYIVATAVNGCGERGSY